MVSLLNKVASRVMRIPNRIFNKVLDIHADVHKLLTGCYEGIDEGEKLRIVFVLSVDAEWDCFSKIYQLFCSTSDTEVSVIADNYPRKKREQLASNFLGANGIIFIPSTDYFWKVNRPHVIFMADEISVRRNPWILRSKARIVYIPYGTSISAALYSKQVQYNLPIHNRAWKIFVAGEFVKDLYGLYCKKGNDHVIPLGHPKSEIFYEVTKEYRFPSLPASTLKPRIFLWNIQFRDKVWSTWNEYGNHILKIFSGRDDVKLICRPHPFFFESFDSEVESERIRNLILQNKNTILDEDSSMKNSFFSCDALITDGSTVIYDFDVTSKPILYLRDRHSEKLHPHCFDLIKSYHYIGDNIEKISSFVHMICANSDQLLEIRKRNLHNRTDMPHPIGIGSSIRNYVESEIRNHQSKQGGYPGAV